VLHQRIVLLHVKTENIPRTIPEQRIEVQHLNDDFHSVVVHYGFMEQPDIPHVLESCAAQQLSFNMMDTSFFVGRLTIVPTSLSRWHRIKVKLFVLMHRNALAATEFFYSAEPGDRARRSDRDVSNAPKVNSVMTSLMQPRAGATRREESRHC
jgi:KUP system potassium uptake protein